MAGRRLFQEGGRMADILTIIKRAAIEAVESRKPVRICFGQVVEAEPLRIMIDQKLTLEAGQLVIPEAMVEHEVEIEMDDETDFAGEDLHSHAVTGIKTVLLRCGLRAGERVILMRMDGGQRYIIIGRLAI